MEDLTLSTVRNNVVSRPEWVESNRVYWDVPEDQLMASPEKMYLKALATRERLPDRFHEAMMLWSFDPSGSVYCKMYLDWVSHCEEMRNHREKLHSRIEFGDKVLRISMTISFSLLVLTLVLQRLFND